MGVVISVSVFPRVIFYIPLPIFSFRECRSVCPFFIHFPILYLLECLSMCHFVYIPSYISLCISSHLSFGVTLQKLVRASLSSKFALGYMCRSEAIGVFGREITRKCQSLLGDTSTTSQFFVEPFEMETEQKG